MSNSYPIVLIHGFCGWGRDQFEHFRYWGGLNGDLHKMLESKGYKVITASVGPFTSSWDRCCELYAQLKGGRVDYGENHSKKENHNRYGRVFEAAYPEWGELNERGERNKIHIIGHSMGGNTARMFAHLMANGYSEEADSHPLFHGGKDWIHSVTTISSPNQGTTLSNWLAQNGTIVKKGIVSIASFVNSLGNTFDPYLDQWNISHKQPSETIVDYITRISSSTVFQNGYSDTALSSSTTYAEEHKWVKTVSNVYYFSFSTLDTHASRDFLLRRIQRPNITTMHPFFHVFGSLIGGRYTLKQGFSQAWQPNDGIANTISQSHDGSEKVQELIDLPTIGKWNSIPVIEYIDHCEIVGIPFSTDALYHMYEMLAKLLYALPKQEYYLLQTREELMQATTNLLSATKKLYTSPLKYFQEHAKQLANNKVDKITLNVFTNQSNS